jgi:hypothetical protein
VTGGRTDLLFYRRSNVNESDDIKPDLGLGHGVANGSRDLTKKEANLLKSAKIFMRHVVLVVDPFGQANMQASDILGRLGYPDPARLINLVRFYHSLMPNYI